MSACPRPSQLDLLRKGLLNDPDRDVTVRHLATCPVCSEYLAEVLTDETAVLDAETSKETHSGSFAEIPAELRDHARYRVMSLLSVGGMGAVYKGEHLFLERAVVIKVIRQDLLNNDQHVKRFEREAKLAAQLSHPNIVTVYEAERVGPTRFLVMECLEGRDLGCVVSERGPLPAAEACGWIMQAAEGLEYIHSRGMVHRDIKPSNLFLTSDNQVKILDLGLACLKTQTNDTGDLTLPNQVFGTVGFSSPEQMERSSSVDIRADIYSLGCTLYYLLSGQAPYGKSTSVIEQVMAHRKAPVPSIHEVRPDVPRELTGPLTRMLAKQPQDRYSTPHEVAEALAPFAPEGYRSSGSIPRLPGSGDFGQAAAAPLKRPRWQVIGGAAFAVFIAVLVLFWAFGSRGGMIPPLPSGPPIKVGILHSRTGTMATSEQPVIDATLFAIDEVNAAGGVLGRPVEALVEDGQSEPATFAQKAEKLISLDGVSAIFGCWTSASRKEVKKVVERHDHLLLYPVQNEGLEESPNIFYIGASPNQQITPAVRWCVTFLNKKRLFLVGSDYIFPRAANAIIRDQARALGAEVVGEEYLPMGATDAAPVARKIRSANPEVILNTINGDTNIAFFRALRAAGVLSTSIPTISFSITEVSLTSLSPKEMAGDYVAWNYFQSIDDPKNTDFLHRFRNRLGARDVSDPMETAYVAVRLWAQAVEAAGSEEVEKVRGPLLSQSFDAPEGLVRIDAATRRAIKFIRIGRMTEDGRCEIVYSSEVPIEPVPYPETRSRVEWETFLTDLQLSWGGQWVNPKR